MQASEPVPKSDLDRLVGVTVRIAISTAIGALLGGLAPALLLLPMVQ
jgi:hypothetical protein